MRGNVFEMVLECLRRSNRDRVALSWRYHHQHLQQEYSLEWMSYECRLPSLVMMHVHAEWYFTTVELGYEMEISLQTSPPSLILYTFYICLRSRPSTATPRETSRSTSSDYEITTFCSFAAFPPTNNSQFPTPRSFCLCMSACLALEL
jgi:hypothetical protein